VAKAAAARNEDPAAAALPEVYLISKVKVFWNETHL
jgi:hypothetical protein